jgi:hypothetical protein
MLFFCVINVRYKSHSLCLRVELERAIRSKALVHCTTHIDIDGLEIIYECTFLRHITYLVGL